MPLPDTAYCIATITNPSAALTDFCFLVDLSRMTAAFKTAWNTSIGGYGRAYSEDGSVEYPCDFIDLDHTAKTGFLRGKWTGTLASSGTQIIRIYPPNTGNALYAHDDTYGSDNAYRSIDEGHYPIIGSTGSPVDDRTVNAHDLTWSDALITVAGGQLVFDEGMGTTGVNLMSDKPLDGVSAFTIATRFTQSFISVALGTANYDLFSTGQHSTTSGQIGLFVWKTYGEGSPCVIAAYLVTSGGTTSTLSSGTAITIDTEYHVVLTYDGNYLRLYINGVESTAGDFPASITGTVNNSDDANYTLGNNRFNNGDYPGAMRDIIIKTGAESVAWASEEYLQLSDQSTFWGTWEDGEPSNTFSASGSSTIPATTASGSATSTPPVFSASGSVNLPSVSASGSAASTTPIFSASGSVNLPTVSASGNGNSQQHFEAAGNIDLPEITASGSATSTPPVFSASGSAVIPAITAEGSADGPDRFPGSGNATIPAITVSGTAISTIPVFSAAGAALLPTTSASGAARSQAIHYAETLVIDSPVTALFTITSDVCTELTVASVINDMH